MINSVTGEDAQGGLSEGGVEVCHHGKGCELKAFQKPSSSWPLTHLPQVKHSID